MAPGAGQGSGPAGAQDWISLFLEAQAAELGAARNTLLAYGRDLKDFVGWLQVQNLAPGAVIVVTGLVFAFLIARGVIVESKRDRRPPPPPVSRADTLRVYLVLIVTMMSGGIIFNATNPALPKAFALDFSDVGAGGASGVMTVSYLVALVYVTAGVMQVIGGRLADLYPARQVYLLAYLIQIPLLAAASMLGGGLLVVLAIFMVGVNTAGLPVETLS